MKKYTSTILALIATALLLFNYKIIAGSTIEATPEELALITYVKDNGGMVNML